VDHGVASALAGAGGADRGGRLAGVDRVGGSAGVDDSAGSAGAVGSAGATPNSPANFDQSALGRGGAGFLGCGAGGRGGGGALAAGCFCSFGGSSGTSAPNDDANEFQ
jgi:hypothetical protein